MRCVCARFLARPFTFDGPLVFPCPFAFPGPFAFPQVLPRIFPCAGACSPSQCRSSYAPQAPGRAFLLLRFARFASCSLSSSVLPYWSHC